MVRGGGGAGAWRVKIVKIVWGAVPLVWGGRGQDS